MALTAGFVLEGVSVELGGSTILSSIDLTISPGQFLAVLGPNGAGKSSLIKLFYRAVKPHRGTVYLDGTDIAKIPQRELCRRVAVVAQERISDQGLTVHDMVALGRIPHRSTWFSLSRADEVIIAESLERVDVASLRHRNFATLSGGERQRVLLARTIAQQPEFLLLDEPTNHLDVRYQLELIDLVRSLEVTVIAALHDLNMVARSADRAVIVSGGAVHANGWTDNVLAVPILERVFSVDVTAVNHPASGERRFLFERDAGRSDP